MKYAFDELGHAPDEYVDQLTEDRDIQEADKWYNAYNVRVNKITVEGRNYVTMLDEAEMHNRRDRSVKLQKVVVPKFDSDPKVFYKWKETFERFTKDLID